MPSPPSWTAQLRRCQRLFNRFRPQTYTVHAAPSHLVSTLGAYYVTEVNTERETVRVIPRVDLNALEPWAAAVKVADRLGAARPAPPWSNDAPEPPPAALQLSREERIVRLRDRQAASGLL